MRIAPLLATVIACGPMYGPSGGQPQASQTPPQATQPGAPQQMSGPPGGGDPQGTPTQPATRGPDDPYADPRNGGTGDVWGSRDPDPVDSRPGPESRPEPPPEPPRPLPPPRGSGLAADTQALLDAHNAYRAQHCAAPLTWSPKLEQVATAWARSLVDQGCKFGHSGGQYGENLAAGTAGTLDGRSVAAMWYDEVKDYDFGRGGFSMNTGHFTQVVWRQTTQVGCGKATCRGMDIWVCNYDPAGNVDGDYRANVKPKGCR